MVNHDISKLSTPILTKRLRRKRKILNFNIPEFLTVGSKRKYNALLAECNL